MGVSYDKSSCVGVCLGQQPKAAVWVLVVDNNQKQLCGCLSWMCGC